MLEDELKNLHNVNQQAFYQLVCSIADHCWDYEDDFKSETECRHCGTTEHLSRIASDEAFKEYKDQEYFPRCCQRCRVIENQIKRDEFDARSKESHAKRKQNVARLKRLAKTEEDKQLISELFKDVAWIVERETL